MKVNCNFLPKEYSAFLLDTRSLVLSILIWLLSVGVWFNAIKKENEGVKEATKSVTKWRANKQAIERDITAQNYPQDRIRRLIEKFKFIQKSMGQVPRPFLRFYQSLVIYCWHTMIHESERGGQGNRLGT